MAHSRPRPLQRLLLTQITAEDKRLAATASSAASADANHSRGQKTLSATAAGSDVVALQNGGVNASPCFSPTQPNNHVRNFHQKLRKMVRRERLSIKRASVQGQLWKPYRKIKKEFLQQPQEPSDCRSAASEFPATRPGTDLKREDTDLFDSSCISRRDQQVSTASEQESICIKHGKRERGRRGHSTRGGSSSGSAAGEVRKASHPTQLTKDSRSRQKSSPNGAPPVSRHSRRETDRAASATRKCGSAGAAFAECITVHDSSSASCSPRCKPLSMVAKEEKTFRVGSAALGVKKRQQSKGELLRRKRQEVSHEKAQTNDSLTLRCMAARSANQERDQRQQVTSRLSGFSVHELAPQSNQAAAQPRPSTQVRLPHATQSESVGISQEASSVSSIRRQGSTLEAACERAQQTPRRSQLSVLRQQVWVGKNTRGQPIQKWPECVHDMLGPEIFNRVKEQPELILAVSEGSGMTMFHHMLRHESRDDEQMLDLFRCIYEDAALKERIPLPCLTELKCNRGQTLAFYAAAYGHVKCLKWILQQAGGVEEQTRYLAIRDELGDTPLHHAAKAGHQKLVELLLDKDPNMINRARWDGRTPIFDAFECPQIIRFLLCHGADCQVRSAKGGTPLEEAINDYRWKRECDSRPTAVLPKRVRATVQLLRGADADASKSSEENKEAQQPTRGRTSTLTAT